MQCSSDEALNNCVSSPRYHLASTLRSSPAIASLTLSQNILSHNIHIRHTSRPRRHLTIQHSIPLDLNRSSIDRHHDLKPLPPRLVTFLLTSARKSDHPLSVAVDLPIARRSEDLTRNLALGSSTGWLSSTYVIAFFAADLHGEVGAGVRGADACGNRGVGVGSWRAAVGILEYHTVFILEVGRYDGVDTALV